MMHFLAFFVASISVFTYFSMWANTGVMHVEYVGEAEESRVLFPAWYLDWVRARLSSSAIDAPCLTLTCGRCRVQAITIPTILVAIGMVGSWAISSIVITCGSALMMLGTLWFGAVSVSPSSLPAPRSRPPPHAKLPPAHLPPSLCSQRC